MKVLFEIPDDLSERFEYIPAEDISDVLSEIFRRGMESIDKAGANHGLEQEPYPVTADLTNIIQAVLATQQSFPNKTEKIPMAEERQEEVVMEEYAAPDIDEEGEEELGDLLDLLK